IRQFVQKLYYCGSDDNYLLVLERAQALAELFEMGGDLARQAILGAFLDPKLDSGVRTMIARSFQEENEPWFLASARRVVGDKAENKYLRVNAGQALSK